MPRRLADRGESRVEPFRVLQARMRGAAKRRIPPERSPGNSQHGLLGLATLLGGLAAGMCCTCGGNEAKSGVGLHGGQGSGPGASLGIGGDIAATSSRSATGGQSSATGGVLATGGTPGTASVMGSPRYPSEKYLAWQAPAGTRNRGPALVVAQGASGGGTVLTWDSVDLFPPEMPVSGYAGSYTVTADVMKDLFTRLANVDFSSLPHPASVVECSPRLYFRQCKNCPATLLNYNRASQLVPEIESVWSWFDSVLTAASPTNPRNYCRL